MTDKILPLRYYGDPVLEAPTTPVSEITDDTKEKLAQMIEAMYFYEGVGLASNQLGFTERMFVWDSRDGTGSHIAINPEITIDPLDLEITPEGCLSVPKFGWRIARSFTTTLTALDLNGNEYTITGDGLLARIFQHETDHLDGFLLLCKLGKAEIAHFEPLWEENKPQ
jgi:peptide deformylase